MKFRKKSIKIFAIIAVFSVYVISGIIFKGKHTWMILFTLLGAFVFAYFLVKKNPVKREHRMLLRLMVFPPILIFIALSIYSGFIFTPTYIIFLPIISILGWYFARTNSFFVLLFSIGLIFFSAFIFFPNQVVLISNRGAVVNIDYKDPLVLIDRNKDTVVLDKDKTIVMDFWTTACSICFKKFPGYEEVYLKYKNDPNVQIYTVNVPLRGESFENTLKLVNKLDYKFPTLFLTESYNSDKLKKLGVSSYPHVIIVRNNMVRYSGRLEFHPLIFINNINAEIKRVMKNKE